jgi:hypothetical protein
MDLETHTLSSTLLPKFSILAFLCIFPFCLQGQTLENCTNGLDDDGDGLIDCFDTDCTCTGQCDSFYYKTCNPDCAYLPPCGPVSLATKWVSNAETGTYSPMVAGDLDADGIPEVITTLVEGSELYILNGATGQIKTQISNPGVQWIGGTAPAIADLDNDGFGEIVIVGGDRKLYCYEHTGALKYVSTSLVGYNIRYRYGVPNIADFDHNGWPEVNIGNQVFNGQTGALLASGGNFLSDGEHPARVASGYSFASTVAADVFPTSACGGCQGLEIIAGNQVLSVNLVTGVVAPIAFAPLNFSDGYTSVADFDGDGDLDAIVQGQRNGQNTVYIWDLQSGTVIRQYKLLNNWSEAASRVNVADLDGDGLLDVSFVGHPYIYALKNNFTALWINPVNDPSSVTCTSIFDFCGDGSSEVVYRSEEKLQILDGATGNVNWEDACLSFTHIENPLILDVDNDGKTEILIECGTNGSKVTGTVIAYEAVGTPNIKTRKVWNQHGYFNTNINDDLSVPQYQQMQHIVGDKLQLNTFMNQYFNPTFPSPDAAITLLGSPSCDQDSILLTVEICNGGDNIFPVNAPISLYTGNPQTSAATWGGIVAFTPEIELGVCDTLSFRIPRIANDSVFLVLNDDHSTLPPFNLSTDFPVTSIGECAFANNIAAFYFPYQPQSISLGQDTSICDLSTMLLNADGQDLLSWSWSDGSSDSTLTVQGPGTYAVTITDVCSILQSDTLLVGLYTGTSVDLGQDIAVCPGETATLSAAGFDMYSWSSSTALSCTNCSSVSLDPTDPTLVTFKGSYAYGCSANDTVLVFLHPSYNQTVDTTICYGSFVVWNGQSIQPDSNQVFALQTIQGCDSTVLVRVHGTGVGTYNITIDTSICYGSTLNWYGQSIEIDSSRLYSLQTTTGCDSTVLVRVHGTGVGTHSITLDTFICYGSTLIMNGQSIEIDSSRLFSLQTTTGCDSTVLVRVHGTGVGTYNITIDTSICYGSTLIWNGQSIEPDSNRLFALQTITGCDSTVLVRVHGTGVGTFNFTVDTAVCLGSTLQYLNTNIEPEDEMTFYLTASTGCDSTVLVRVAPLDTFYLIETRQICYGESSNVFGVDQTTSGSFTGKFTASNGCDSTILVSLYVLPQIQLQVDGTIACFGEANASLSATVANGVPPITYTWDFTGNPAATLDNISAGTYALTVTDGNDCTETSVVTIDQHPQTIFTTETDSVRCFEESNGAIRILSADPSLLFQFNDGAFSQVLDYGNLLAGDYAIVSQDVFDCQDTVLVSVLQPPPLFVQLPADTTIQFGTSLPLQIGLGGLVPVSWTWSDTSYLSCLSCPNPIATPLETTRYELTIKDENGCAATDVMLLMVEQLIGVYIPNVINESGDNSVLTPGFNSAVRQVNLFRIFDRWGGLMHETRNALPGDTSLSWDGRFGGDLVNPGVYVWQIELELADGTVLKKTGDLTVVR